MEREELESYYKEKLARLGYVLNNQVKEIAVESEMNPKDDELETLRYLINTLELILRIDEVYWRGGKNIHPSYALEKLKLSRYYLNYAIEYFQKKEEKDEI